MRSWLGPALQAVSAYLLRCDFDLSVLGDGLDDALFGSGDGADDDEDDGDQEDRFPAEAHCSETLGTILRG